MKHPCLCPTCGEPEEDNAIRADYSAFHKCTRTALLWCRARQAMAAKLAARNGFGADAFACARNAFWYARRAGLLQWTPAPVPRPTLCTRDTTTTSMRQWNR